MKITVDVTTRSSSTAATGRSPPLAVGSRIAFVADFLGRRLAYTYEIIELEPGRRLVITTKQGPFPMETTYAREDTSEGFTLMKLRSRGSPAGLSAVVGWFMASTEPTGTTPQS